MREEHLLEIKNWFEKYTKGFFTGSESIDSALAIKVRHTKNVGLEILTIADSLALSVENCYLAEICAVLHDAGRFEQYARYHTYSDASSENHAAIGIRVINDSGVLAHLDSADRDLVLFTVFHHNTASLPEKGGDRPLFFLKLLRDADKIDILNVVTRQYAKGSTSEVLKIGLPDTPEVSDAIVQSLMQEKIARVEDLRTFNDFKLLQISWVFDINFSRTFHIIKKRNYLEKIENALPQTDAVTLAVAAARRHLMSNCSDERSVYQCQIP